MRVIELATTRREALECFRIAQIDRHARGCLERQPEPQAACLVLGENRERRVDVSPSSRRIALLRGRERGCEVQTRELVVQAYLAPRCKRLFAVALGL